MRKLWRYLWLPSALMLALTGTATAATRGTAVRFIVSNDPCRVNQCFPEHRPPSTIITGGTTFDLAVMAADSAGNPDESYRGTASFSSSDPQARLPGNYTFLATDYGGKVLSATLFTPGNQTITVTDPVNGLTGTLTMTVTQAIPTLGGATKALMAASLAAVAILLIRRSF